ncbi:MAG TPA: MmgE/PrpD family protein [Dongiaceae bacterium]
MNKINRETSIAERLATTIGSLKPAALPETTKEMSRRLLLDVVGLAVAARSETYVKAALATTDDGGNVTAFGHKGAFDAYDAALLNGTAAHGEDFDDTFEGGPVHSGAVIVPALLAACEREKLSGDRLLLGIAVGAELMCRLSLVAPKAIHSAGFHPTGVLGAVSAAGGIAAALGVPADQLVSALGVAGSMASGIIEYLAEGTWTKRMHAGNSAQAGIRAALMARGGFLGPRTVFEGVHGFFKAFAPSRQPDFAPLLEGFGKEWVIDQIAFKPYACGTMTQPFIDCAIGLAKSGVKASEIAEIICDVGEGTVHRLWEPLEVKHAPQTPYAAKFSTPVCMALGFLDGKCGFAQFTEERLADPKVTELARKIRYRINPNDEYPKNFTGHLKATLKDGSTKEIRQGHMRGGAHDPLPIAELEEKFLGNARYGGWDDALARKFLETTRSVFTARDLSALTEYRQ